MAITIQSRKIAKGQLSLYLYFHPPIQIKGKTRYKESLGIYVPENPKSPAEKRAYKALMAEAELILSQRRAGLISQKPSVPKEALMRLSDYAGLLGNGKVEKKTQSGWQCLVAHLDKHGIGLAVLQDLTITDANDFRSYLLKSSLAPSSQVKYFGLFRTALRAAVDADLIGSGIVERLKSIKGKPEPRQYLVQEELDRLIRTPNRSKGTRAAWIHSCLCGMRYSDVKELRWKQVVDLPDGRCEIHYTMKKTKKHHVLPISAQNRELMGDRPKCLDSGSMKVFPRTPDITQINRGLKTWVTNAGIDKRITFHCARHTFATLSLSNGTPIEVVSAYLGHSSIAQTEVYAKLLDQTKQAYVGSVKVATIEKPPWKSRAKIHQLQAS
jgi:integrase